jgi:hypothetical protein
MKSTLALMVLLAACGKKSESAHMSHARELLSVQEWATARTELKLEVKDHPDNNEAKGLLLFCMERVGDKSDDLTLFNLDEVVVAVTDPEWNKVPTEVRDAVNKELVSTRQQLFDKGIDTKDARDLGEVVKLAATYCFASDDDPDRKNACAAILAGKGDQKATTYLIDRLKSQKPEAVVEFLVRVGDPVAPFLKKAIADQGFIGRAAAADALSRIEAVRLARKFSTEHPGISAIDSSAPGNDRIGPSFVASSWRSRVRAHVQYAQLENGDGVLLLQGWSPADKYETVVAYSFHAGETQPLRVTKDGKSFDLSGKSAVFDLAAKSGAVVFRRYQVRSQTVELETGQVSTPAIGMRVKIKNYQPRGRIAREDGGLWVVKMDQPIEGMSELTVPATSMIGLGNEEMANNLEESISGKVVGNELQIVKVEVSSPEDPMSKMKQYKDEMCACTSSECAQRVSDDMTKWGQEQAKSLRDPPKLTTVETKVFTQIGEQMGRCMQRAMGG